MKWRGKQAGLHFSAAPLRIEKEQAIEKLDFVSGADAPVKILEIGAATERNMLAIVDVLAVGQDVRSCTAAEERALFEKAYPPARVSQREAGCQPAADHDHVFQECSLPSGARNALWR